MYDQLHYVLDHEDCECVRLTSNGIWSWHNGKLQKLWGALEKKLTKTDGDHFQTNQLPFTSFHSQPYLCPKSYY